MTEKDVNYALLLFEMIDVSINHTLQSKIFCTSRLIAFEGITRLKGPAEIPLSAGITTFSLQDGQVPIRYVTLYRCMQLDIEMRNNRNSQ